MTPNMKPFLLATALGLATFAQSSAKDIKVLNLSYDPTRELYVDFNAAFAKYWKEKPRDNDGRVFDQIYQPGK